MRSKTLARSWRSELATNKKLKALNRRLNARKLELKKDKEFKFETPKLCTDLEQALVKHSKSVRDFLHHFSHPAGPRLPEVKIFLSSVRNRHLRKLFRRYVKYVSRFGVVPSVRKGETRIDLGFMVPWGRTIHVRVVDDHFEPGKGHPGGGAPFEYFFESDDVPMSLRLREQIHAGKARFVLIDDSRWSSVLSQMEYFAYDPECLTFILHKAQQPFLLVLVGEKVQNKHWSPAKAVVTAFLQEHFNRGKAGRPRNLRRFQEMVELLNKPGLIKNKLTVKGEDAKDFLSEQAYAARVGKLLRSRD